MDELSERYGALLAGAYGCVDRIVLNAYFSLGITRAGSGVVAAPARPARPARQAG